MIVSVILLYVVSVRALVEYSDEFSRNIMFPLSAAAYSDKPQLCVDKLFPNSTVHYQLTVRCDSKKEDTCSGYTALLHAHKAIVISFRGTSRLLQLVEEVKETELFEWSDWMFGGRVSKYFHDAFLSLWNSGMNSNLQMLRSSFPSYEIWVTGHSLGGSLASLAASYIVGSGYAKTSDIKLVTFGQPRTGDTFYSTIHNKQVEYSFRVIHWRDLVPHIPIFRKGGYRHHRQEAFYKSSMKPDEFKICKGNEEIQCSDGLYFVGSIRDHTHYFDKQVSSYGISGCI